MGWGWGYKPYVPVAKRRAQAEKAAQKAVKAGLALDPVNVQGRSIAKTFWGKAWCDHLEAYSDFENRLPRGRTYVRNGSVIDLQIHPGKITAKVMGSALYQVTIDITALPQPQWQALMQDCTGSIATLVELLMGRLSQPVMERLCAPQTGMFPAPRQIKMACSCPDWAGMCKHVAATLYGVGARLDARPELLFTLRQVDANDLLTAQAAVTPAKTKKPTKAMVLEDAALADVFGLDLAAPDIPAAPAPKKRRAAARAPAAELVPATSGDAPARVKSTKKDVAEKAAAPTAKKAAAKKTVAKKAAAKKTATGKAAAKKVGSLQQ
ncbi:MAG: hypothetical protein JSS31_04105 [Proteobacteria bacterium]|nr:hypothetical protein [Pseudomonadota bacterium]MBS0493130.1 hypothetical protein [Pseudomonadota bacterium]